MDLKVATLCSLLVLFCSIHLSKTDDNPSGKKPLQPVVVWHGAMECDETYNPQRMAALWTKRGAKAKIVKIGTTCQDDKDASIYMRPDLQVMNVCRQLIDDPDLKDGFTLLGLSQGGALTRALVQGCPELNVTDLITVGAPHQGNYGISNCSSLTSDIFISYCEFLTSVMAMASTISPYLDTYSIFTPFMNMFKDYYAIASLWVDPLIQPPPASNFINNINNRLLMELIYKKNLLKLRRFISVWFIYDTTLVPKESAMFGYFKQGSDTEIVPYNETDIYVNDDIGLKEMDEDGRFILVPCPYEHMKYPDEWFEQDIIDTYYTY